MLHGSSVLRLLKRSSSGGAVCKSHPSALAAEASVGEASGAAIQPRRGKSISVGCGEGVDLGVGTEVLVGAKRGALVGGKARLVEGRSDAWPGAEAPGLRWHEEAIFKVGLVAGMRVPTAKGWCKAWRVYRAWGLDRTLLW
jgi:hypothetical protein